MAKRMSKAARKKRLIRVTLIIVIVLTLIVAAVNVLQKRVTDQMNEKNDTPTSAAVTRGSISTTVSGSGNLTDEDVKELKLHSDVEIDEILVEAGDKVQEGDLLATVNMSTVLSAMADIQGKLNDLDDEIGDATGDELDSYIKSTIGGRVMKIFAAKGDDVSTVMYDHGALALLSLDGFLAVEIETDLLEAEEAVTVTGSDGTAFDGRVERTGNGMAVVLISDEKAVYGDTVTVTNAAGTEAGTGELYIHEQMKITGIAGTISSVYVRENQKINTGNRMFYLTDASFSANYTSLLEEREELVEQLQRLIKVYHDGAILSDISGTVSGVADDSSATGGTQSSDSALSSFAAMGSYSSAAASGTGTTDTSSDDEKVFFSICPGTQMTVTISVDESDILCLQVGQSATITVDALDDETVSGTVTEIDTTATSSGGVTVYTATVTFDKTEDMLSGMSASVSIVIEGVDDALLIPSDALTQTRASAYVYTGYNSESGEFTGMVEVTSGMDNGEFVEITGGLSEGDTVYYFEKEENRFTFPFGNMGGMSGMSGMGGMSFDSGGTGNRGSNRSGSMPGFGG